MTDWSSQDSFITPGNQFYRIYFNSSKIQSLFHILQKRNCSVCLTTFSYYYAEKYYGKHRCMVLAFSWEFSNVQELDYLELQQEWSSSWESLCNSLVKRQVSKKIFFKVFLLSLEWFKNSLLQRFPSSDSASCFFPFYSSWFTVHRLTKFGAQESMYPYLHSQDFPSNG